MRLPCCLPTIVLCCLALPFAANAQTQQPASGDYTLPASGQMTVPAEGGLTFQMMVNGAGPFATVFDTGAVNVISLHLARQLGLSVGDESIDFGAIGGAVKVQAAHVDSLKIGELTLRNQLFYVLDIPQDAGTPQLLVGWELMQRFAVTMDFEHSQLTFIRAATYVYRGHGTALPLLLHTNGNGIDVMAKVDGIEGRFLVDSGNETGLFLNAGFVNEHHLVDETHAHLRGYNGRGLGGPSPEAWFVRLHSLKLGPLVIDMPIARLQTAADGMNAGLAGNIGQSTLSRFTVTVDMRHAMLYLDKNAAWSKPEVFNRTGAIVDFNAGSDEVMTVLAGSPAAEAGLRVGDRILAINGQTPSDSPSEPLFLQPAGTVVSLKIQREGTLLTATVTLRNLL